MKDAQGNELPDTQVPDTQEDFENQSQNNAIEDSDAQRNLNWNRKRTGDAYQQRDLNALSRSQDEFDATMSNARVQISQVNAISQQALMNAVKLSDKVHVDAANDVVSDRAMARKHADVAANAMWDNALNPVTQGAGNDLTGQAPVNAALASTASLVTVLTNLSAQVASLVTGNVTLGQALAQSNASLAASNAALAAQLSQLTQNAKQGNASAAA